MPRLLGLPHRGDVGHPQERLSDRTAASGESDAGTVLARRSEVEGAATRSQLNERPLELRRRRGFEPGNEFGKGLVAGGDRDRVGAMAASR